MRVESLRDDAAIERGPDGIRAWLLAQVGTDKRILQIGGVGGDLPRAFREQRCRVVAVEPDPEVAARASVSCDRVIGGDIERVDLARELVADSFDVVVLIDLLERVGDPVSVLRAVRDCLRTEGYLVATVANVAHVRVRLALLCGRSPGDEARSPGRRALRYYSRQTMEEFFEGAGLAIGHIERHREEREDSEVPADPEAVPAGLLEVLSRDPEAWTYRFLVVAYPASQATPGSIEHRLRALCDREESVQQDLVALRRTVEAQTKQLETLMTRVNSLLSREDRSRGMLPGGDNRVLRHDIDFPSPLEELRAGLGGDRGGAPDREARYRKLIDRIRQVVRTALPRDATVIVISKGDDELLKLDGRRAWHFPQVEGGVYAGHHPADSRAAIDQVEELRARGGRYLLVPETAFWWLDHYAEFRQHLEANGRVVVRLDDTCLIYALGKD